MGGVLGNARAIALTGNDQVVSANPSLYYGFSIRETSGSATALVRIFDNASTNSGTVLDEISLTANQSARELYPDALRAVNGVYLDVVAGAVAGSVRVG